MIQRRLILILVGCLAACASNGEPRSGRVTSGFNSGLTRNDSFCSIETAEYIYQKDAQVTGFILSKDAGTEFVVTTNPQVGDLTRDGDAWTWKFGDGDLAGIETLTVSCFPRDAAGTRSDLMRAGNYVSRSIDVYRSDPHKTEALNLEVALEELVQRGGEKLRIHGSPVTLDGESRDVAYSIIWAHGQEGKSMEDLVEYSVTPSTLTPVVVQGPNKIDLTFDAVDLLDVQEIRIDAYVRNPADPSQDLVEQAKAGNYTWRTFEIIDSTIPTVRLDILDKTTANRLFGETFAKEFYACSVHVNNPSNSTLIVYGASVNAYIQLDSPAYEPWVEHYRPLAFASILESMNDVRRNSTEQDWVNGLEFVGKLAAGATVFVTGTDYATGVALFTGIFTPEVKKLLLEDVLAHLSNLQSLGFQEVEEIAPRSQLSKYLFLPKGDIYGIVGGNVPAKIIGVLNHKVQIAGYRVLQARSVASGDDGD